MGRALILAAALVARAGAAHADPQVSVAPSCATVIDPATVIVALRVELRDGTDRVYVDCPAGEGVVVALGDTRTAVPVEDVDPPDRPRVVALAVAEQLRPPSTPAIAVATIVPADPPSRYAPSPWMLTLRIDGVAAAKANAAVLAVALARRFGRVQLEVALGGLGGSSEAGSVLGVTGDLRVAVVAVRRGRTEVGIGASLLGIATTDATASGGDDRVLAARGELRVELGLGASGWRGLVAGGPGRALSGDAPWFASVTLGVVHGL